jgi:subtilase family serine protease
MALRGRFAAAGVMVLAGLVLPPGAGAAGRPDRAVCPGPVAGGFARCHAHVITDGQGTPATSSTPSGYGPTQFHGAYGLGKLAPVPQTLAIVDAYDDPSIRNDLTHYDSVFGIPDLPSCSSTVTSSCFQKVNQAGSASPLPSKSSGWALEIALDVETAHEICQNCKVLLVEAGSSSLSNLEAAVNTAARLGAGEISNSYGGSEFSGETGDTAYNHPHIAVTVSSGDNGYGSFGFPAASPYVVAVGGTTLNLGAGNTYGGETVWSGGGSGCSSYLAAQSWQTGDPKWSLTGCGTKRAVADVAADADPNTGAAVYDTTRYSGRSGWFQVGGTSLSSPLIAGVYALAGNASTVAYPASTPYASRAFLHDVTSGSNGSCTTIMCAGAPGYDGPTGVGTPNGTGSF